jgi:hypothetical protein
MITAVEIENFKGIGGRVRLELRPITLLFGPNSGGKSTFFHALSYAREVLLNRNLNLDHIRGEEDGQRLGGFRNFVHKHDLDRKVRLRLEFDFHPGLRFADFFDEAREGDDRLQQDVLSHFDPTHGWVEVVIAWHRLRAAPYVASYRAGMLTAGGYSGEEHRDFEDEGFEVRITANPDRRSVRVDRIEHIFRERDSTELGREPLGPPWVNWRASIPSAVDLLEQPDALPDPAEALSGVGLELPAGAVLSKLALAPYQCLQLYLGAFKWLAAWRDTPARPVTASAFTLTPSWTGGLAAWFELLTCKPELLEEVNAWLREAERLDLGYALLRRTLSFLEHGSPLWLDLFGGRVFDSVDDLPAQLRELPTETQLLVVDQVRQVELHPQDVGMGLMHLLPVVVAALIKPNGLIPELWGFDEPELHAHPRLQAALGDLLIIATRPGGTWPERKSIIVGSHSEHLALRLLRRIRESNRAGANSALNPQNIAVWHVAQVGESVALNRILVDVEGQFVQPWPEDDTLFEQDFRERYT